MQAENKTPTHSTSKQQNQTTHAHSLAHTPRMRLRLQACMPAGPSMLCLTSRAEQMRSLSKYEVSKCVRTRWLLSTTPIRRDLQRTHHYPNLSVDCGDARVPEGFTEISNW